MFAERGELIELWVIVIQAAEIGPEPNAALIVGKQTSDRRVAQCAVGCSGVFMKYHIFAF